MGLVLVGFGVQGCSDITQPTEESPSFGLAMGDEKVTICHKGQTITVAAPALASHLAQGNTEGPARFPRK